MENKKCLNEKKMYVAPKMEMLKMNCSPNYLLMTSGPQKARSYVNDTQVINNGDLEIQ